MSDLPLLPNLGLPPDGANDRAKPAPNQGPRKNRGGIPGALNIGADIDPSASFAAFAAGLSPYLRIDPEQVAAAVADEIIRRRLQCAVEIRTDAGETRRVDGLFHKQFHGILVKLARGRRIYAWGPPGSGKTTLGAQLAKALGVPLGYLSGNDQTPEWRLTGLLDARGVYHRTSFRDCVENGGLFLFDEFDNISGNLATTLNAVLENGLLTCPDGPVEVSSKFFFLATGNTPLRGATRGHSSRRPADAATIERFSFVRLDYDEELETRIALQINPECGPWLDWIRKARAYAAKNIPDLHVTPRASYRIAEAAGCGLYENREDMIEGEILKGLGTDASATLMKNVPLPSNLPFVTLTAPTVTR